MLKVAAIKAALVELGYDGVYHMSSIWRDRDHANLWIEALEIKYEGKAEPWTKENWDHLLGDYQVCISLFVLTTLTLLGRNRHPMRNLR